MENLLNNSFSDVQELRKLIINSNEYKNYIKCLEQLKSDDYIDDEIQEIVKLQKRIVNYSSKKIDTINLEKELDNLNKKLYSNNKYSNYINSAKKLNVLITKIQNRFNEYFDSLVS